MAQDSRTQEKAAIMGTAVIPEAEETITFPTMETLAVIPEEETLAVIPGEMIWAETPEEILAEETLAAVIPAETPEETLAAVIPEAGEILAVTLAVQNLQSPRKLNREIFFLPRAAAAARGRSN